MRDAMLLHVCLHVAPAFCTRDYTILIFEGKHVRYLIKRCDWEEPTHPMPCWVQMSRPNSDTKLEKCMGRTQVRDKFKKNAVRHKNRFYISSFTMSICSRRIHPRAVFHSSRPYGSPQRCRHSWSW